MPANLTQALLEPIARQRRRSRLHLGMALSWCAAAFAAGLLLLAHHYLGWTAPAASAIVLVIAILGIILSFSSANRRTVTARDVAREIEDRHPELNALIQSAVEQEPDPDTGQLNFLQRRVIDRATGVLQRQDWVRHSHARLVLTRTANQLGVLALMATLIPLFRLAPSAHLGPAAKRAVGQLEVLPGDTEIEKGSTLVVMAKFPGKGPIEANLIVLPSKGDARRLTMNRNLDDPTFGVQVPNVTDDLVYRVEYPEGKTREYKATVFEYPRLMRGDASLKYPAYTGLEPKTIEDTRRINSVESTELNYALTLNKAVASSRLWSTNGTELPLTTDPGRSNVLHLATTLTTSGRYFLTLVDAAGRSNRIPDEISIVVVSNKPPEMKLVSPRGDPQFSPLEEVRFQAEVSDDFGLIRYGLAYSVNGGPAQSIELGGKAPRFDKQKAEHLLRLEDLKVKTDDLISYYLWADDYGPDGQPRRTEGDIFFGDIRPLDEIYREGQQGGGGGGGQQQQGESPSSKLLELQKDIIAATWNVKRASSPGKPGNDYKDKMDVIHNSQQEALSKAGELASRLRDARMQLELSRATDAMTKASTHLADAASKTSMDPLPDALGSEQTAYQHLLRLQAREFEVTRGQRGGGGGGGGQRNQRQLDQLDLANQDQRYENERQAKSQQTPEQREDMQVLSRLQDLARRQNDLNDRVKELQTELLAAKTEEQKEELKRELKRLQEQQQQLLSDLDELNQRMSNERNQERMSDERKQLEKTRENLRSAADQLAQQQASSALASGTRAQQNLESVRDDFRKRTSSQFSDEMRDLRNSARELTRQELELQRQFESLNNDTQKSLSDSPLKKTVEDALAQQQQRLTNILESVRRVSEESEVAEPLLSRQLYDTYRDTQHNQDTRNALPNQLRQIYDSLRNEDSTDLENTYQVSKDLVQKGFAPWGQEVEKLAQNRVTKLSSDIQKAAESILGDDLQALRTAEREMERLNKELSRDVAANSDTQNGNPADSRAGQAGSRPDSTNQLAQAQSGGSGQRGNQSANGQQGEQSQTGQSPEEGQNKSLASGRNQQGRSGQQGQSGQAGEGQGQTPGQNPGNAQDQLAQSGNQQNQQGQQAGGQSGQSGGGRGQGQGEQNQAGNQAEQPGGGDGQGRQSALVDSARANSQRQARRGQAGGGGGGGDRQYSLANDGANDGGGGGDGGWRYNESGIFTGNGYVDWADRLRDVEEMIDDPDLRQQIATVRDRAREVRIEAKRHSKPPQWSLVRSDILKPMLAVHDRIQQEIARRQSPDNMIAIDRDPVPGRYSELVRRYYEKLGGD